MLKYVGQAIAKGVHIGGDGSLEVAHLVLVVIAHIDEDAVLTFAQLVECFGVEVLPALAYIEGLILQSVGKYLVSHLDDELVEALSIILDGQIKPNTLQEADAVEMIAKGLVLLARHTDLRIDSLPGHICAPEHPQLTPVDVEIIPE